MSQPRVGFALSAGFSDDAVLQKAPAKAAIYGLTPTASAKVTATITDDSGKIPAYTVRAVVSAPNSASAPPIGKGSGTADPLCQPKLPTNDDLPTTISYNAGDPLVPVPVPVR